jgi:ABC-2 type transport system permease protein
MMAILQFKFWKYWEITKIAYFDNTAYIGDVLAVSGTVGMRVWIFSQLYANAFRLAGTTELGGLSLAQTLWILALSQGFHVSNRTRRAMKSIEYDIKGGNIVHMIGKPYNYALFNFFSCFGSIFGYLFIAVGIAVAVAIILTGPIKITLLGIAAGLILLFFGFILNSLFALIIGLLAFWTEDISAFRWIYDKLLWVLGGIFLPLSLFPDKIRALIEFLPFNHLFYGPARLIISFDAQLFWKYLLIQIVWVVVLSALIRVIYKRGMKGLSINGG